MTHTVRPIPEGYHAVTPYLFIKGAANALEFYKKAFGAKELMRMAQPDGRVGHAEIQIGDSHVMMADEFPEMGARSPKTIGGSAVMLHLYVEDVDAVFQQAVAAGAKVERPVEDQFYGDRGGKIRDPFGHLWWISTHTEDVPVEELNRRAWTLKRWTTKTGREYGGGAFDIINLRRMLTNPAYKGQAASGRLRTHPAQHRRSALEPVGHGMSSRP